MHKGEFTQTGHKDPSGGIVETAREARAGYLDRPVLAVVTISTGLALAVLLLMWWLWA